MQRPLKLSECPVPERILFKNHYKIAAKPMIDSFGNRLDESRKNFLCSYGWIKFDDADIFCATSFTQSVRSFYMIGQGTAWKLSKSTVLSMEAIFP